MKTMTLAEARIVVKGRMLEQGIKPSKVSIKNINKAAMQYLDFHNAEREEWIQAKMRGYAIHDAYHD